MNLEEAANYAKGVLKNKGINKYDLILSESDETGIQLYKKKVSKTDISNSRGMGVRLIKNQSPGYSYTEKLEKGSIEDMVQFAIQQSEITAPLEIDLPNKYNATNENLELYNPGINGIDIHKMKSFGMELEDISWGLDKRIDNIPYVYFSKGQSEFVVLNSNDLYLKSNSNFFSTGISVVAKENESIKMGSFSRSGGEMNVLNTRKISEMAVNRSVKLLNARPVSSGVYPVVLTNRVASQIFSMFTSPFYADMVQKGQSRLSQQISKQIATKLVSIDCDPHLKKFPGSRMFDGEGVPTKKVEIIQEGYLKNYLYNLESAKKEGRESTGSAARSYSGRVGTTFSNLIFKKGHQTLNDLLQTFSNCLLVEELEGGAGCSAISGEISIGIQGRVFEKGLETHSFENNTMNINFFELLKLIVGVSNEYYDSYSSIKVPDLLIEKINVAG